VTEVGSSLMMMTDEGVYDCKYVLFVGRSLVLRGSEAAKKRWSLLWSDIGRRFDASTSSPEPR
jgi:hypothetical protein